MSGDGYFVGLTFGMEKRDDLAMHLRASEVFGLHSMLCEL